MRVAADGATRVRVRAVGRHAESRVRRIGDRRGARAVGRHGDRFAECAHARRAPAARRLLVLDNFEQVLDAAPLVADLLSSVASLRVLVTSRAPLRVRGRAGVRRRTARTGRRTRTRCPPPIWRAAPAVRLFVERVRDVQPDFRLTSANGPTVAAICRRLDALPLALELAAPWMKVLTAEDLLRRLEPRCPALDRRPRAISPNGSRR